MQAMPAPRVTRRPTERPTVTFASGVSGERDERASAAPDRCRLVRRGAPTHAVQAPARHAELEMTQKYAHVAAVDLRKAIATLNESVAPVGVTRHSVAPWRGQQLGNRAKNALSSRFCRAK
jgi:hypothetical protein